MVDHGLFKRAGRDKRLNRLTRAALVAVLAGPLLVVPVAVGAGTPAGATTALPFNTKFEIDGNTQIDSTGDWLSTAAQYPELRDNTVVADPDEPCGAGI